MEAFLRQVAAVSVITTICELALPSSRSGGMTRLVGALIMMLVMLGALTGLLSGAAGMESAPPASAVMAPLDASAFSAGAENYLSAKAGRIADICRAMAENAGYASRARAHVAGDGSLISVEMELRAVSPAMDERALARAIAGYLQVDERAIILAGRPE